MCFFLQVLHRYDVAEQLFWFYQMHCVLQTIEAEDHKGEIAMITHQHMSSNVKT